MNAMRPAVFALLLACAPGNAQTGPLAGAGTAFDMRINSKEVLEAVEPVREKLQESSAAFFIGNDIVAYGMVVSEDGMILSKASQLPDDEKLYVRIDETRYGRPQIIASDEETDLVLVKVEAKGLTVPEIDESYPDPGTIVVSNGSSTRFARRAKMGVISAPARPIAATDRDLPYLGVSFSEGLKISEVPLKSPAATAGLKVDDILLEADHTPLKSMDDFAMVMDSKKPGDLLPVKVRRGRREFEMMVTLGSRLQFLGEKGMPLSRNDMMSGYVSKRRDGFPMVLEHDSPLPPSLMGGPLLDLHGKVRGLNIARANRAETYALPIDLAMKTCQKLISQQKLQQ